MSVIEAAISRAEARTKAAMERPPIDYARMQRVWPMQKANLTRALNEFHKASANQRPWDDPTPAMEAAREKVARVCKAAVAVWNEVGAWPDDWSRFQRALDDVMGYGSAVRLEDL
jgi:hypothetical protein